jgi:MFS family permease
MMANLFPILATQYAGLSAAAAGSIYGIGAVVALSGPLWGWLADHVSHSLVLSARSVGNVLSSVLWLLFPTYLGMASGRALDDLGKAAFRPAWGALMAHVSSFERPRRARIMGYLSAGEDAGEAAGPIVAGLLWSAFGIPAVLGVRIGLAVVAELYALRMNRRFGAGPAPAGALDRPAPARP